MSMPSLRRRRMLLAISQLALAASLAACGNADKTVAPGATGDSDLELLASVAYDLFPYPGLQADLYVQVSEHLLKAGNPVITAGLQQLRTAVGAVAWKQVDEAKRLAVLTELQTSAFFAALRAGALEVLYRSPEMFDLVGYGGSAIEKGGYINRGFADIDWLPAATK